MRRTAGLIATMLTRLRETVWPGSSRYPAGGWAAGADGRGWVSGEEPMTAAQRAYLEILARELGERVPPKLTKAQASERIDRLRQRRLRERRRRRKARLKGPTKIAPSDRPRPRA